MKTWKLLGSCVLGLILAALLAAVPVSAQQMSRTAVPVGQKVAPAVALGDIQSVLGAPKDDASGVSDFTLGNDGEAVIAYRYYDVDQDNYETDFASEIAPRLQMLYKKLKGLDRVRFEVLISDESASPMWKPFSEFAMDRKTLEKLHWTWFVSRDILDQVLKNAK